MIRQDKHKLKNRVVTQIRVVEGYRNEDNKPRQRTIKNFGYLEDQKDPESFMLMVKEFDANYKKEKNVNIIKKNTDVPFYEEESSRCLNFGYKYFECILDTLQLDKVFEEYQFKGSYSLYEVFKFLVINRIISPDSKRATMQMVKTFYGKKYDFDLADMYRSLDHFNELFEEIQKKLNDSVTSLYGRDMNTLFFDTTNFYFERDLQDEDKYIEINPIITDKKLIEKLKLKNVVDDNGITHQFMIIPGLAKRGVSKEHRVDPIVEIGLMMDKNGIPISMQVYPGNTADSLTLNPILEKTLKNKPNKDESSLVVADKGINTTKNIDYIVNSGNDYMFSQILKGKKGKRYQDKLFDESLYTVVNKDYKYQLFEEEYEAKDNDGKKVTRKRKVLIYWNGKAAARDKKKRDEKIFKAEKSLKNNAYNLTHGYDKYLKVDSVVGSTGEVADQDYVSVDYDKAKLEEKYDGYFAIITSRLDFDEAKIREIYHGLWRIEDSFRITKSELEVRPIFLKTEEHIRAHLLICYVALIVLRLLQNKMGYTLSVERIVRALSSCACSEISKGLIHCYMINSFEAYGKKNKDEKEYYTLNLSENENETINDLKEILQYYQSKPCSSVINKSAFDKYFNNIKLNKASKKASS